MCVLAQRQPRAQLVPITEQSPARGCAAPSRAPGQDALSPDSSKAIISILIPEIISILVQTQGAGSWPPCSWGPWVLTDAVTNDL